MAPTSRDDVERFLVYPTDHVIGVIDDAAEAQAALAALLSAGFSEEALRLFHGPETADQLDFSGTAHGFLGRLIRLVQGYGDVEHDHFQRYGEALRAGHFLISVHVTERDRLEQVYEIVKAHKGRNIDFFGRWTVEELG